MRKLLNLHFATKLALSMILLAVLITGPGLAWLAISAERILINAIGSNLRNVGQSGAYLLDQEQRGYIQELKEQAYASFEFSGSQEELDILNGENEKRDESKDEIDDSSLESLPPGLSENIMQSAEYQSIIQILRRIREGSVIEIKPYEAILPDYFSTERYREEPPGIYAVYLYVPVPGFTSDEFIMYLADGDYAPYDEDRNGEYDGDWDFEGNPIGNIAYPVTQEQAQALQGVVAVTENSFTQDQWGDVVISSFIPILDQAGNNIAVMGIDLNVTNAANQITALQNTTYQILGIAIFFSIVAGIVFSIWFNRPIAELSAGAKRISEKDFSTPVNIRTRDEFANLAHLFNDMTIKIGNYAADLEKINASFERFVPKEFLQQLGRENIVDVALGEQVEKEVAIQFSDIRSYSKISEQMAPDQIFRLLNDYLKKVSPIIRNHHGFIDKFIGDAIMAIYPYSSDNAIRSAVEMQKKIDLYNLSKEEGTLALHVGMGLHSGKVILGTVGEQRRMEGTVISDSVNIASRVQNLAKPMGARVLATEATVHSARESEPRHSFNTRFLGNFAIKGKQKPVRVFEIVEGNRDIFRDFILKTKSRFEEAVSLSLTGKYQEALAIFSELEKMLIPLEKMEKDALMFKDISGNPQNPIRFFMAYAKKKLNPRLNPL